MRRAGRGKSQGAYHRRGSRTRSPVIMMMKMVEPYMSIMSPASSTPTLSASAAASTVPTMTGVPGGKSGLAAARARDAAGDVGRPGEFGQPIEVDDAGGERVAPACSSTR